MYMQQVLRISFLSKYSKFYHFIIIINVFVTTGVCKFAISGTLSRRSILSDFARIFVKQAWMTKTSCWGESCVYGYDIIDIRELFQGFGIEIQHKWSDLWHAGLSNTTTHSITTCCKRASFSSVPTSPTCQSPNKIWSQVKPKFQLNRSLTVMSIAKDYQVITFLYLYL